MRHARASGRDTLIDATETGILHRMEQESPGKRFIPANRAAAWGIHPVVLGAGTPYFPELESPIPLRKTATHRFESGVVYVGYERA